jgi:hypothetical protein
LGQEVYDLGGKGERNDGEQDKDGHRTEDVLSERIQVEEQIARVLDCFLNGIGQGVSSGTSVRNCLIS